MQRFVPDLDHEWLYEGFPFSILDQQEGTRFPLLTLPSALYEKVQIYKAHVFKVAFTICLQICNDNN